MIIFEEPRNKDVESLFQWARETTEKLNRLQTEDANVQERQRDTRIRSGS